MKSSQEVSGGIHFVSKELPTAFCGSILAHVATASGRLQAHPFPSRVTFKAWLLFLVVSSWFRFLSLLLPIGACHPCISASYTILLEMVNLPRPLPSWNNPWESPRLDPWSVLGFEPAFRPGSKVDFEGNDRDRSQSFPRYHEFSSLSSPSSESQTSLWPRDRRLLAYGHVLHPCTPHAPVQVADTCATAGGSHPRRPERASVARETDGTGLGGGSTSPNLKVVPSQTASIG